MPRDTPPTGADSLKPRRARGAGAPGAGRRAPRPSSSLRPPAGGRYVVWALVPWMAPLLRLPWRRRGAQEGTDPHDMPKAGGGYASGPWCLGWRHSWRLRWRYLRRQRRLIPPDDIPPCPVARPLTPNWRRRRQMRRRGGAAGGAAGVSRRPAPVSRRSAPGQPPGLGQDQEQVEHLVERVVVGVDVVVQLDPVDGGEHELGDRPARGA